METLNTNRLRISPHKLYGFPFVRSTDNVLSDIAESVCKAIDEDVKLRLQIISNNIYAISRMTVFPTDVLIAVYLSKI